MVQLSKAIALTGLVPELFQAQDPPWSVRCPGENGRSEHSGLFRQPHRSGDPAVFFDV